jgi:hypothetical protein
LCPTVTDMVATIREELNKSAEKSAPSVVPINRDEFERDKAIKNYSKIPAPPLSTSTFLAGGTSAAIGMSSKTRTRGGMSACTHATTSAQAVLTPSTMSPLTLRPPTWSPNGFNSSRQHDAEVTDPFDSTPPHTNSEDLSHRESQTVSRSPSGLEEENYDSDGHHSYPTTSTSYPYTVNSINSYNSRTAVLYPRPVRPEPMDTISESAITGLDGLSLLSDQPASSSTSPHGDSTSFADTQVSQLRAVSRLGTYVHHSISRK